MRAILALISLLVPRDARARWLEEWRAELAHARWTMVLGAPADAWAVRAQSVRHGLRAHPFHAFPQDVRYAIRGLLAAPGFTVAAVASLSIGIAVNTTAFSVLSAVALRPFPGVQDQESLVRVLLVREQGLTGATFDQYLALRGIESVPKISALHETEVAVGRVGTPANVPGAIVTANYFDVLGVKPVIGRFFVETEDVAASTSPAAVISYRLWQHAFAGDRSAIGQWIAVNGEHLQVIGVAPEHFAGVQAGSYATDVWITFAVSSLAIRDGDGKPADIRRVGRPLWIDIVGRLAPGATVAQALAEIAPRAADTSTTVTPSRARVFQLRRGSGPRWTGLEMLAFMAVPFIVLAIACVNAANLMLARSARRATEWRVRLALGGSRWRVLRQILTESVLVSLLAAGIGLVLTYWTLQFQQQLLAMPMWIDWRVLAFTMAAAVATALLFGIGPALAATRAGQMRAPSGGGAGIRPGQRRVRAVLVAVQAALSLALLITGAQLARAVLLSNVFPVPDAERLLVASFDLDKLRYTPQQSRDFYARLATDARKLPGARAVVVAGGDLWGPLPFDGQLQVWRQEDPPGTSRKVHATYTAGDLHGVLGVPLISGRSFRPEDHGDVPKSVIVNERFVKEVLPDGALGRTIRMAGSSGRYENGFDVTIVGIVPTDHGSTIRRNEPRTVYYPSPVEHQPALNLFVRFEGSSSTIATSVRALVRDIDDGLPFAALNTAGELQRTRNPERRWVALAMTVLALASLVLAASGLFSVVSYVVSQRQREIGIRMTLGADRATVLHMILRQALTPTAAGSLAGLGIAAAVAQVVRWGVHGAPAIDVVAFAGAAGAMLMVMAFASLIPARRATRVDPMTVLRQE